MCSGVRVKLGGVKVKGVGLSRVLLFSDLHLGHFPRKPLQLFGKRLLGAMNHFFMRRGTLHTEVLDELAMRWDEIGVDVTVCGGDLTSVSLPEEFRCAEEALRSIRELSGEAFIYVPGNHDVYVRERRSREVMASLFKELNGGLEVGELPMERIVGGLRFLLVNGALATAPWMSNGEIGGEEAERIEGILKEGRHIGICHFPALDASGKLYVGRHGLNGGEVLGRGLSDGRLSALLSGHVHHAYSYDLGNGSSQLCSGSITMHREFIVADFNKESELVDYQIVEM